MDLPSSKQKGRPQKKPENKKSERVVFMVTPSDFEAISKHAQNFNLTLSEYCNKIVLNAQIMAPFTEEELRLKRGLVGMANNLNQIAYQANAAGFESVQDSCRELLKEIKVELEKYR